jgi:uncharacterized protein YndB with AHSA1/START domain
LNHNKKEENMSLETQSLVFEKTIKTAISQAYQAFTNSTRLREWMCDLATTEPKTNGRFYLAWTAGFYACGHFTTLEKNRKVGFTWYGRGEPRATQVTVTLTPQENGVHIHLEHSGLGKGEEWEGPRKNFNWGWENGLENLVSVLETGQDLRLVRRPMLGILLADFNEEMAKKMKLPITEGIRLSGVVQGLGAEAAGLQANDVLIQIGRFHIPGYAALADILSEHRAGDEVEVVFYRESKLQKTLMKLSSRPTSHLPDTLKILAHAVEETYASLRQRVEEVFTGVTEEQASHRPADGEWSAKETLAHLIHSERGLHTNFQELVCAFEPIYDGYENIPARLTATLQAYPTLPDLLQELFRLMQETIYFLENIPESFTETKSSFWRLAFIATNFSIHLEDHLGQIKRVLETV